MIAGSRWSWPYDSPNLLGAHLASIFPWLWLWESRVNGWRRSALFVLEAVLLFALCKTHSRGALFALGVAAVVALVHELHEKSAKRQSAIIIFGSRFLTAATFVWATGFSHRMSANHVTADASILNRLELWQNAIAMVSGSPISGWGYDRSGEHYFHWFQPMTSSVRTGSMVNTYLQVINDLGLMGFFTLVALACFPFIVYCAARKALPERSQCHAAFGCLSVLILCIGNIFSILINSAAFGAWHFFLWGLVVAICAGSVRSWRRIVAGTVSVAIIATVTMYAASRYYYSKLSIRPELVDSGTVLLRREPSANVKRILFVPDRRVNGDDFGKQARRFLDSLPGNVELLVAYAPPYGEAEGDAAVLFGGAVALDLNPGNRRLVIYPIAVPGAEIRLRGACLIIPRVHRWGQRRLFEEAADDEGIPVSVVDESQIMSEASMAARMWNE